MSKEKWKKEWLDASGATIDTEHGIFRGIDWGALEVYTGSGEILVFALASLTGPKRPPYAFGYFEQACFHQGSTAKAAKPVARALVAMLDAGLGTRAELLDILSDLPFSRFLTRAERKTLNLSGGQNDSDGRHQGSLKRKGESKQLCDYGIENGELHGLFTAYWGKNRPQQVGQYSLGQQTGRWQIYHAQGWLQEEGDFDQGKKVGRWFTYESKGGVRTEDNYRAGMLDGTHSAFHFGGARKEQGEYRQGKKDGLWTCWFYSGEMRSEVTYAKGRKRGKIREWNENGTPV